MVEAVPPDRKVGSTAQCILFLEEDTKYILNTITVLQCCSVAVFTVSVFFITQLYILLYNPFKYKYIDSYTLFRSYQGHKEAIYDY